MWGRLGILNTAVGVAALGYIVNLVGSLYRRAHQRNTATRALLRKVHHLHDVICRRFQWWAAEVDPANWLPPLIPITTDTYDQLVQKIPRFRQDVAEKLMEFYGFLQFLNEFQRTKDEHQEHGQTTFYYKRYAENLEEILTRHGDMVFRPFYKRYNLILEKTACVRKWEQTRSEQASKKNDAPPSPR